MSYVVQVSLAVKLDQHRTIQWDCLHVITIFVDDFLDAFFGFLVLHALLESLRFNHLHIKVVFLIKQVQKLAFLILVTVTRCVLLHESLIWSLLQ